MKHALRSAGWLALAASASAARAAAQEPWFEEPWFEEVGLEAGVDWRHESGACGEFLYPEGLGGGAALFDADGDGDLDLYLVQSGSLVSKPAVEDGAEAGAEDGVGASAPRSTHRLFLNRLFLNRGDGTFESSLMLGDAQVDATTRAGLGHAGYGMGVAAGDYDQDGDVDLYVTNVGPNVLYENQGDGTFRDVTVTTGAGEPRFGSSAAFLDVDGDGDLDLFCVNNLNWSLELERRCTNQYSKRDYCGPRTLDAPSTDTLFVFDGARFRDASEESGLLSAAGNGLGIAVADDDRDGDLDVYVANDGSPNALWRNDGSGRFSDVATRSGCSVNGSGAAEAGMGVQWLDADGDGELDLFLSHLRDESNTFYRGRGGRYADRTRATGLVLPSLPHTGFGLGFHDFDLDGQLDLLVSNGAVQAWQPDLAFDRADLYAEPNQLFRGSGGGRFEELEGAGLGGPAASRAAAFGDLDGDGDVDAVVVDRDARVKLLRNVAPRQGRWLGLRLLNERGAFALGAEVRLEIRASDRSDAQTIDQRRLVARAYGYFASHDPRVLFGVPAGHEALAVHVRWPGSLEEESYPVPRLDAYQTLKQR